MGLLKESRTLSWEETQQISPEVKRRGAEYFVEVYKKAQSTEKAFGFLWGEEIEQNMIIRVHNNWVLLVGSDLLIKEMQETGDAPNVEYARYMVETTPKKPYEPRFTVLGQVEKDMEQRRAALEKKMHEMFGEEASVLYLPCFPLLGTPYAFGTGGMPEKEWASLWEEVFRKTRMDVPQQDLPEEKASGTYREVCLERVSRPSFSITRSKHFPDFGIASHRRFHNFTYNIRERKGRPLHMEIPPARIEKAGTSSLQAGGEEAPSVVIDSMGQGMGCCCLQITMQSESLTEARVLYDTIGAICPLLLFLTMGTSVVAGVLTQSSTRWDIVSASVDCRKATEDVIKKSRYSSIDLYIAALPDDAYREYNDINPYLEKNVLALLLEGGVDKPLANHIASLYVRDPILCYEDSTPKDDFENIQSSNWRSMRLKPPTVSGSEPGAWLVEIRPMEIQPTSFENTAYSVFVVMFSRMVVSLNANFYVPISKVDENFQTANTPASVPQTLREWTCMESVQKFWYRENIFSSGPPVIKYGTIEEIFLGTGPEYCGILGAIDKYLQEYNEQNKKEVVPYLAFIRDRVSGRKTSVATYIRSFVARHPKYGGDSLVSREISNDLVEDILRITKENSSEYLLRPTE
ncbi:glutamate--cysteine ligase catalytic subunit [Nematocida sp. AWRm77]|nr:glutamate--cysteine ligase catalytic subunit [Nematocida sp. AWRm77]